MRSRVYARLGEAETDNLRLPAARVDAALNDAYVRFAQEAACFKAPAALTVTADDPLVALPADAWRVRTLLLADDTSPLPQTSEVWLDTHRPGWRTEDANSPEYWTPYDAGHVQLVPTPSATTTATALVEIVPSDAEGGVALLADDDDVPALPSPTHEGLVAGAVAALVLELPTNLAMLAPVAEMAERQFGLTVRAYRATQSTW